MKSVVKLGIRTKRTPYCRFLVTAKITYATKANLTNENESVGCKQKSSGILESDDIIHMAKMYKASKNISVKNKIAEGCRTNEFNIQMLSTNLHKQVFGEVPKVETSTEMINEAVTELKSQGLWNDNIPLQDDVQLNIPSLKGNNIEEHFYVIGKEQSEQYKNLASKIIFQDLPKLPSVWLIQKGWTKYEPGKKPVSVSHPDEDVLVFDVEVCIKLGGLPTIATAASCNAWYGWVCSDLCDKIDNPPSQSYNSDNLIPFYDDVKSEKNVPKLVIGHNVSYDRVRIKEEYSLESNSLRFLDTMSLHICIAGMTKNQKPQFSKLGSNDSNDSNEACSSYSCLTSLKDVYSLYCNKELIKDKRNIFLEGTLNNVRKEFQNVMKYCATDVIATQEVFKVVFPIFLERFPHPVTLAGMLEMSKAYMTVSENWKKFLMEADQTYEDLKSEMSLILSKKSDYACRLFHNDDYKQDLWMWNENWSTQTLKLKKIVKSRLKNVKSSIKIVEDKENSPEKVEEANSNLEETLMNKYQYIFDMGLFLPKNKPFLPGYPSWYRKLCEKADSLVHPTTSMMITPKLLHLMWEKYPLFYVREFGWGILVADIYATEVSTSLPFQKIRNLTMQNINIKECDLPKTGQSINSMKAQGQKLQCPSYYDGAGIWCGHTIDDCCYFFKLPHKDGPSKNVGNPLSKDFSQGFAINFLGASDYSAKRVIDIGHKLSYWRNNRVRVYRQMVVWLNKTESLGCADDGSSVGVILPMTVVCGTLTRRALEPTWLTASKVVKNRIGSELRALVQAPPGYHLVGGDVDSQELWIASVIGDSYAGKIHGITPLSWMTLSGNKADGTDMHSMTAKAVGISRDHAKVLNYSRIYGAGVNFAEKLLLQFNPGMGNEEAKAKARKMYELTKGRLEYEVKDKLKAEFVKKFKLLPKCDAHTAYKYSSVMGKKLSDVFKKSRWIGGTESAMFNRLEEIALSYRPTTPFLSCRLSRALESQFEGEEFYKTTRINWVVQSGAVDFLHLMLVCMRWLTKGQTRYCFSFHDEIRYLVPSEKRYSAALAIHITNLLVRAFCSFRLGMYDLPQSVAFFSSVEVDKVLRKEANDDCITPSNPHGMEKGYGIPPGESLNIYETIKKTGGNLYAFDDPVMSTATKRKHVHREALEEELSLPQENQQIVRVLGSRGNNLHEVQSSDQTTFLVSMPKKFRKNIWVKKGDFILVEPIEEGGKVKAEMVKVLRPDQIKYLKNENAWPPEFMIGNHTNAAEEEGDNIFVNGNRTAESYDSRSSSDESN